MKIDPNAKFHDLEGVRLHCSSFLVACRALGQVDRLREDVRSGSVTVMEKLGFSSVDADKKYHHVRFERLGRDKHVKA